MKIDLTGKVALVTGSSSNIGFAVAKGLAASGTTVILNGRDQSNPDNAAATLACVVPSANIGTYLGQLGTAEGCAALVAAHGACNILVKNLDVYSPRDFFETPGDEWARFFEVNVMFGVRFSRAYLPAMVEKG